MDSDIRCSEDSKNDNAKQCPLLCGTQMEPIREGLWCPSCGFIEFSNNCPRCKIQLNIWDFDGFRLCCPKCGLLRKNPEYDLQYSFKKTKQVHSLKKHFSDWVDIIFGMREGEDFEKNKTKILKYIEENKINSISPKSLRKILKELKLNKYYKYTSSYLKAINNVQPPNIPKKYLYQAEFLFQNWTEARKKTGGLRKNLPSYPYLIYKIFDTILPKDDAENRRIFNFIHLPSEAVLKKRDEEWELVYKKILKK